MASNIDKPSSNMDNLVEIVAQAYANPKITQSKCGVSKNVLGDTIIHDDVSVISGKLNLNMLLRRAAEFYSGSVNKDTVSTNHKEIPELKAKVARLSALVDRLKKMCDTDETRELMADELSQKKQELDSARERLGVITQPTVVPVEKEKLAAIKAVFKILSNYWNYPEKAQNLYNAIRDKVTIKIPQHVIQNTPVYHKEEKKEEDSEWEKVSYKKKSYTPPEPSVDYESLIKKYEAGQYIPVQHRKKVEEIVQKRKAETIQKANAFPSLCETKKVSPKSTMQFKNALEKKEQPVTITVTTVEKESSKLVIIETKSPEPKLLQRDVRGMVTVSTYEFPDGTKQTIIVPNHNYSAAKQKHRDYMQYLRDKRTKFWIAGMSFEEWLDFRDEVDEMIWQEEEERKQAFLNWYNPPKEVYFNEDNEEFDDDSYVDYNQEFPNKEYTVTC